MGIDRKTHGIALTMKAKDAKPVAKKVTSTKPAKATSGTTQAASGKKKKAETGAGTGLKTTFGDLFKDHINGNDDKENEEK
jgi:hypothetical protein